MNDPKKKKPNTKMKAARSNFLMSLQVVPKTLTLKIL